MVKSTKRSRGARQEATSNGGALGDAAPAPAIVSVDDLPPLFSLKQIARHLNVSRDTLRRMTANGIIPHVRVGSQLRYDLMAVRAALATRT